MASSAEVALVVLALPVAIDGGIVGGVFPVEGGSSRNYRITKVFSSNLIKAARKADLLRAQSGG